MIPEQLKIGFVGAGNMASSIIKGITKNEILPQNVFVFDIDREKTAALCHAGGLVQCAEMSELVRNSEIIFLAVKPNVIYSVIEEIRGYSSDKAFVSIAAGCSVKDLRSAFGAPVRLLRVMPNTPALAGEGMCAVSSDHTLLEQELSAVLRLLSTIGLVEILPDYLMDAATGLSGSGPAFVYLFIEALADAGVLEGLPRPLALEMAAQTVLGSAKMVLESGKHPGQLKDEVCSPGGTTIEGVFALEDSGFRAASMHAVHAATEKSRQMGRK